MNVAGSARAIGVLRIAGVEREVALDVTTKRTGSTLTVQGGVDLSIEAKDARHRA